MPTTEQQRRALTFLAKTIRDDMKNAPKFDEPGIIAALGKVRDLDVSTVAMAVIRCAADQSIKTPAMIGVPSSSVYVEKVGPERARRFPSPAEACHRCGNEFSPSCCDKPTQRPAPGDYVTHAAIARAALRATP